MTVVARTVLWAALLVLWVPRAGAQPAEESFGRWVMSCPREGCTMRHRDWIVPPMANGASVALEVRSLGGSLVPAVVLGGLPTPVAAAGVVGATPAAQLSFDGAAAIRVPCRPRGYAVVCAPEGPDIGMAALQLQTARTVRISVTATIAGKQITAPGGLTLDLSGAAEGLARLRSRGIRTEMVPAHPGLDAWGLADLLLRDMGFEHGAADVLPQLLGRQPR